MTRPAGVVHGLLLADRYRLAEPLAVGATGEVWRAPDLLLDRPVAVKTLRPELVEGDAAEQGRGNGDTGDKDGGKGKGKGRPGGGKGKGNGS